MPVARTFGVPMIIIVAMMIAVMVVSIVMVVIMPVVCVAMMVMHMFTVFRVVNVDVRDFISGVAVPERGSRLSG